MTARTIYRVQYIGDAWHIGGPAPKALRWMPSREAAIAVGVLLASLVRAKGGLSQLVVHNKAGRLSFERTYGCDPRRSPG